MKITEDVRKYAAEQKLCEDDVLKAGMEQKSREFAKRDPSYTQRDDLRVLNRFAGK